MRICFVWFNIDQPVGISAGVSLLSRELSEAGHEVEILHLSEALGRPYDEERILAEVAARPPELWALSFHTPHWPLAQRLARRLRSRFPDSVVLCGGVHTTCAPEDVMKEPAVDAVCVGEADGLLVEFVRWIESGRNGSPPPNFWARTKGGVIRSATSHLPDIAHQTLPDFSRVDYRRLIAHKNGFAEVISGRGCALKCTFCQNDTLFGAHAGANGDRRKRSAYVRHRAVENLMAEIESLLEIGGADLKGIVFGDDAFLTDRRWVRAFVEPYSANVGLPFTINAIASQVTEGLVRLLADSGCNLIRLGIESGNETVRAGILGKPISNRTIGKAVCAIKSCGLNTQAFGMIGIPGEEEADLHALLEMVADLRFDVFRLSTYYPLPGTALFAECARQDILRDVGAEGGYMAPSLLRWPPERELFLEKMMYAFPLGLTARLGPAQDQIFGPLWRRILAMKKTEWNTWKACATEQTWKLYEMVEHQSLPHYRLVVAARPDYAFLRDPSRVRKLVGIDQG